SSAIALINAAEENDLAVLPSADDALFGGDLTGWKQFANSIKLRILARESDVKAASYITEQLAKIDAEGSGFIEEDATINPGYANLEDKQNPYWEDFGKDPAGNWTLTHLATSASDYAIAKLSSSADPRIDRIFEKPATGHKGVPQGITATAADYHPDLVSNIGPGILKGADMGSVIMTVAETYFNRAELGLKGFGGGDFDPKTMYEDGVAASFATLGVTGETAVDDYLTQNRENVNYDFSSNKLAAIMYQKWVATMGVTAEQSWFDYTRTGFPSDIPLSQEIPGLVRPVRLSYPASEVSGNAANVPAQPNVYSQKIFWAN